MSQEIRVMRKTVPVTVAGAAIALALIGAASAQADPQPNPPTPQYPVPTWVGHEARTVLTDALQRDGYDPEYANDIAQQIIGHYLP
jgi:hypothetical protein